MGEQAESEVKTSRAARIKIMKEGKTVATKAAANEKRLKVSFGGRDQIDKVE